MITDRFVTERVMSEGVVRDEAELLELYRAADGQGRQATLTYLRSLHRDAHGMPLPQAEPEQAPSCDQ